MRPMNQRQMGSTGTIRSYEDADRYLRGRNACALPGRSTRLVRDPDYHNVRPSIAVWYHDTPIVRYHDNGRIVANPGAYRSPTTKAKIAIYSPIRFVQRDGQWQIWIPEWLCELPYPGGPVVWWHQEIETINGEAPVYPKDTREPAHVGAS